MASASLPLQSRSGDAPEAPLRLLCRRGDVVVLDKPANMLIHPPPAGSAALPAAATHGARYALHECASALGVAARDVHFVSRLDRATSGVLVAALSSRATRALQAAWADGEAVRKEYLVLVARHPVQDAWTDERELTHRVFGGAAKAAPRQRDVVPDADDDEHAEQHVLQHARTDFTVLARFPPLHDAAATAELRPSSNGRLTPSAALSFPTALLLAAPHTGRWHQIRRHLSHAGHHVLGDTRHGKLRYNGPARAAIGLHRLFLHAVSLRVNAATLAAACGEELEAEQVEPMHVVSPLPHELLAAVEHLPGWGEAKVALRARGLLAH